MNPTFKKKILNNNIKPQLTLFVYQTTSANYKEPLTRDINAFRKKKRQIKSGT